MPTKKPATTSTAAKKKKTPRAAAGGTTARVEVMRAKALEMLLAGHKNPAIGAALGISRERAWQLSKEALELLKSETLEDAETWRALLTQEHIEQLGKGKVMRASHNLDEVQVGLGVVDKALSQLRGLWVPSLPTSVKQEVTGANGQPLALGGPDLSKLSDEQLKQLESLLTVAGTSTVGA